MNQELLFNLLTIVPFALWGYIALGLNRMKYMLLSEQRLNIYIVSIFIYFIVVFYYTLLMLYLKKSSIDNEKRKKYCIVCLVTGFVFLSTSLGF